MVTVAQVQPSDPAVAALIEAHQAAARLHYAPEDCHSEDADALADAATRMFAASHDGKVIAIGGYKLIGEAVAEVKSVYADPGARGLGAGKALMGHLMADAKAAGVSHLLLEAGTDTYAAPARALYTRMGFSQRGPFGAYSSAAASTFMECAL
ncbi:GNAT family N-acetyltransferase [Jannaschia sp. CCS1]|uniref:GNAT family N-acetyltransferase n=1 Tax=Jannaschia sp. (strain CCS1) TaxID=290400 RepID=UPI00006C00E6|nr:GNAT family N-acetyltransferase [Jannaschia sp. CCS1]ABD56516.1 GCN5-related N-acetyltransferase [Jannaschia sp. CCS1]